ncbi:hypothetical protein Zmor_004515 [Zophobas morio]|jgi:pyruvate kinase|uniref:Pyruvate kinase n=1 Tax=Zophobas morio TaxID=2755281 RepID=A0AA38M0G4_9CUCU|nr:hypothetical protein Zmor_004515 [Zophobas morio]
MSTEPLALAGQTVANEQKTRLSQMTFLDIYSSPDFPRKSSIICTIGPGTGTKEMLLKLREAGMNIMRLNFSHGSHEFHGKLIDNLRETYSASPVYEVAIALDTKGPEIRTGINLNNEDIQLEKGQHIRLTTDESYYEKGQKDCIYCDYKNLPKVISKNSIIYVDDGLLSLKVIKVNNNSVDCEIQNNGILGSRKGCNLPNIDVDLPALSEKDKKDLEFGVQRGVDMIFASFIRRASDVKEVRKTLGEAGKNIKIIAKIENHQGVRNFDAILAASDGIMVARGDLGIEVPPEKVFLAQKMMISKCNLAGKPVICATQMLESMTYNPRPTRAEVSDVANAILDGADCVMLSGETAKGKYPVEAIQMMAKTCREAESAFHSRLYFDDLRMTRGPIEGAVTSIAETIAVAAVQASFELNFAAIIVLSTSGTTARLVSKYRPKCPIFMVTRVAQAARQAHLYRGVYALHFTGEELESFQDDVDWRLKWAIEKGKEAGHLKEGDQVICIQGWRGGIGNTNSLRILCADGTDLK